MGVYFQNDNINTFDKDAELRLTIMSSIAQDEVRKLSERTRFGFKRAQENSVLLGQNNLFGYNKVDGRLEIVEPEAAVVREVFERYAAGDLGLRAIANDLDSRGVRGRQGKPLTYSTLYGMIRNPKYKGCYAGRAVRLARLPRQTQLPPECQTNGSCIRTTVCLPSCPKRCGSRLTVCSPRAARP